MQGGDVSGSTHSACRVERGAGRVSVRYKGAAGMTRGSGRWGGGRAGVAPLQPVQALRMAATHYESVDVLHRRP